MDDTFGPVRDATAEALGTLLKVMGERPLNPYIEQLDKIKMDKVWCKIRQFYTFSGHVCNRKFTQSNSFVIELVMFYSTKICYVAL